MSASILIIGDSWGTINGFPESEHRKNNLHLENFLIDAGHVVKNFSIPAGSNCQSMHAAKSYLLDLIFQNKTNEFPDYIIWFHTESLRDYSEEMGEYTIENMTETLCIKAYQTFKELLEFSKARAIVIGGQAPVLTTYFDDIVGDVELLIPNWHSEILGVDLPFTHVVCYVKFVESKLCIDTDKEKINILDKMEYILDLDKQSNDFPDHCHPGTQAHKNLSTRILKVINNQEVH